MTDAPSALAFNLPSIIISIVVVEAPAALQEILKLPTFSTYRAMYTTFMNSDENNKQGFLKEGFSFL